jgi:hypothetical protein
LVWECKNRDQCFNRLCHHLNFLETTQCMYLATFLRAMPLITSFNVASKSSHFTIISGECEMPSQFEWSPDSECRTFLLHHFAQSPTSRMILQHHMISNMLLFHIFLTPLSLPSKSERGPEKDGGHVDSNDCRGSPPFASVRDHGAPFFVHFQVVQMPCNAMLMPCKCRANAVPCRAIMPC